MPRNPADRPATEPRTDYSDPGVTIDQLLAEGWRPDGHRNIPHTLDEDECWCNESRAEAAQGAAPRAEGLDEAVNMLRRIVAAREMAWLDDEIEGAKNWLARLSRPSDEPEETR